MSYTVEIIDNDTGEVVCKHDEATCIIGVFACDEGAHQLAAIHCTSYVLSKALNVLEDQMKTILSENSEIRYLRLMLRICEEKQGNTES